MRKGLIAAGLSVAILTGACSAEQGPNDHFQAKNNVPVGVGLAALQDVIVYKQPNVVDTRLGVIKAGQTVTALCYRTSESVAADSIKVAGAVSDGYAVIQQPVSAPANSSMVDVFNATPGNLRVALLPCEPAE